MLTDRELAMARLCGIEGVTSKVGVEVHSMYVFYAGDVYIYTRCVRVRHSSNSKVLRPDSYMNSFLLSLPGQQFATDIFVILAGGIPQSNVACLTLG